MQPNSGSRIQLRSGQSTDIEFTMLSKTRIPRFSEELHADVNGVIVPLCSVQGACHGYNIWLETAGNSLPFGALAQRCSTTKRIVLHNDGDIGATFKWDVAKLAPEFSVSPSTGYISPSMQVNLDITFQPLELATDIRKENVKCFIEGLAVCYSFSFFLFLFSSSCDQFSLKLIKFPDAVDAHADGLVCADQRPEGAHRVRDERASA